MDSVNPFSLRKVPRLAVNLYNSFFEQNREFTFKLAKESYTVTFYYQQNVYLPELFITVQIDYRQPVTIALEKAFVVDVFGHFPYINDLAALPENVRAIALEVALAQLLDRMDRFCGCRSMITDLLINSESNSQGFSLFFKVTRDRDGFTTHGRINADVKNFAWILEQLKRLPKRGMRTCDDVPLSASIQLGKTVLPLSDVSALESYDILLVDNVTYKEEERDVFFHVDTDIAFSGTLQPDGKIVIQNRLMQDTEESGMSDSETNPPIDTIPVTLVFELGERTISVGELRQIQPGYTFDMETALEKPVTIKANGKAIGKGDMVQVGDRIGVRIIEFNEDAATETV